MIVYNIGIEPLQNASLVRLKPKCSLLKLLPSVLCKGIYRKYPPENVIVNAFVFKAQLEWTIPLPQAYDKTRRTEKSRNRLLPFAAIGIKLVH